MRSGLVSLLVGFLFAFCLARFFASFARFLWLWWLSFSLAFFFLFGGFSGLVFGGFETRLDL